jgi:hypothetical protein
MKKSLLAFLIAAAPLFVFAQLPSYLPTEGLVGWWPFNGNANDESGNGNDGVLNGATLTNDRFGYSSSAVSLDGINDKIEFENNGLGLGSGSFTINFYFKSNDLNGVGHFLRTGSRTNTDFDIYYINNVLYVGTYNSFSNQTSIPFVNYLNDEWHSLVISWDGNNMATSLNNNLLATITPPYAATSSTMTIGEDGGGYCNVDIDDVAIYNRALTPEEITALYTGVPNDNSNGGSTASTSVPAAIAYQAVARDNQGQSLSDTDIQVKFTLLADSLTGAAEYSESHSLTTNALGLFTTAFGAGTPLFGTFTGINWAAGNKYLKVELDTGAGFVDMGTQQLLSVPYAIQAKKSTLLENNALPVYSGNAAALAGGLVAGQLYRTATGDLKIVY